MGGSPMYGNPLVRFIANPTQQNFNEAMQARQWLGLAEDRDTHLNYALQRGQGWVQKVIEEEAEAPYRAQREIEAKRKDELRKQMLGETDVHNKDEKEATIVKAVLG